MIHVPLKYWTRQSNCWKRKSRKLMTRKPAACILKTFPGGGQLNNIGYMERENTKVLCQLGDRPRSVLPLPFCCSPIDVTPDTFHHPDNNIVRNYHHRTSVCRT